MLPRLLQSVPGKEGLNRREVELTRFDELAHYHPNVLRQNMF